MADDEARLTATLDGGVKVLRIPAEWLPGTEMRVRKVGESVVVDPVPATPVVHPSWPPGFWDWVDSQRDLLDLGEIEPFDLRLQDVDLDDVP